LVEAVRELMARLLETPSARMMKLGWSRAEQLIKNLHSNGLTAWTAIVVGNLANPDFIFCLGLDWLNMRGAGVDLF
jgi:hypothetical protein